MARKQVLRGNVKHSGEGFEAGAPASKLPTAVRQRAKENDFLMDEDAFMVYAGLVEEVEDNVEDDETGEE